MSFNGEEMIDMLKSIKKHVYELLYDYHYRAGNYYYRKVDAYGPEYNDRWEDKVAKHMRKELKFADKLHHLGES